MDIKYAHIASGVTAPLGFKAAGIHCGIRKNKSKKDLALIYCEKQCTAAGVYTQNLVCGAPVTLTKQHLADGRAQAVICNSGIANTCNADGMEKAKEMSDIAAAELKIKSEDMIVASTGVIGQPLDTEPIRAGMPTLVSALSADGSESAAQAIMTTDTRKKEFAITFTAGGKECRLGLIAKGSGMIHPNMATMLCFITTDCAVSSAALSSALKSAVSVSFNMLSVDSDTSTNDTVCVMASALAGNEEISDENHGDYEVFADALGYICTLAARELARDGEGATKLVECTVSGAVSEKDAKKVAKSVICSPLVKTAMFGADANWGRVLCAMGYSGAQLDVSKADVYFSSPKGRLQVCKSGAGIDFSEELAAEVLSADEILISIDLSDGEFSATAYGCDLTYDYVKINGDYRT